ncbi:MULTISPECIES: SDR family NAD(P)-dependent oxidoreductase [Mycobacterium]|uniref:Short-chain dehydrogenase/reductase n=1 Tax=Mycobacterium kiyosense TaxID=2871094 RepID=A0A9P3Q7A2_9MYCO|nr:MULTISPECIES: SDR family NAD(P)-dependent oxidoreductase [Mycobacterium]BDE11705.1 putative Short-chain dehydrogenase/reductase [Mycobacterium sp. 20KCMC460]GLB81984.1 putative Short-chain dehydrogenase/reductase [Mycobacterium kiyosense]GLB88056.1 putative Short-chain dehydrogenase/reductase [Mycobacterium kiyosense]GLB95386.1 putative Short-chain dehydrogenase/reductase [Mycobacterium kiyosense]GLC01093.1 putative Short-chain dehydrogenase/reductase [Mycobacterium kiyosense]
MNLVLQAVDRGVDRLANPARISDPDRLRAVVSGKTALVTGASYGIGEATARKLAAAGATVLVVARSAERLDDVAASITAGGGQAVVYPTDLSDEDAVAQLAKQINENHGPLDVVVSNAGKSLRRSLHEQYDRPHDFQRTIGVNYLGPVWLLLGILPLMREAGRGQIVNVSSVGVRVAPGPQWGAYQASKGAFDRWLRSVAPELQLDGIDVSTIYFALVRTRMIEPTPLLSRFPGLTPDQAADAVAQAIIERPRTNEPPWVWPAELASVLLAGPAERAARIWYRRFFSAAESKQDRS